MARTLKLTFCLTAWIGMMGWFADHFLRPMVARARQASVDFKRDVEPIFQANCYQCHSAKKASSQLRLDVKSAAMKGGISGAVIIPGNGKDSRLLQRILGLNDEARMPMGGLPLKPEQIDLIKRWIDEGATWPDDESAIRNPQSTIKLLWLAMGSLLWWLVALLITGDPLFIKHNWPNNWPLTGTVYGAHGLLAFTSRLPEAVGLLLLPIFIYGLVWLVRRKELFTLTSSFLLFFVLHTILRAYGLLGSAGYPRYLVAISPAIAIITLVGWNELAKWFSALSRPIRIGCAATLLATSAWLNFVYADGAEWSRDARAINAMHLWFQSQPAKPTVTRFIWSKPYAGILFDRDPWENPAFAHNQESDIKLLGEMPVGTLALWDERAGPKEFGLHASDFQTAGFTLLNSQSFNLGGYILDRSWFGFGGVRQQTIYLLLKEAK